MKHTIDPKVFNGYKIENEIACATESQKSLTMVTEFTLHANGKLSNRTYFDVHCGPKLEESTPSINIAIVKYNSI